MYWPLSQRQGWAAQASPSRPPNTSISGDDLQVMVVQLRPKGGGAFAQPGCVVWCDSGVESDISTGGLGNFLAREWCFNESGFLVHWRNTAPVLQGIGLSPNGPGKVVPIELCAHSSEMFLRDGALLAATDPLLSFSAEKSGRRRGSTLLQGLFGGQGFLVNKVTGQGWVFLVANGAVMQKHLAVGESIVVDQGCLVAWETTVTFGYRISGGLGMICCGGEGLTNSTVTGPGLVIVQSVHADPRSGGAGAPTCRSQCSGFLVILVFLVFGLLRQLLAFLLSDVEPGE